MSEKAPKSHEQHRTDTEHLESAKKHLEAARSKIEKEASEAKRANQSEQQEHAAKRVEQVAESTEQHRQRAEKHNDQPTAEKVRSGKREQKDSLNRTMVRVRKKLNPVERPLSRIVHNPVVNAVSEVAGKTVARPSSMLGGAFFALVGTSALLWVTKHYGYEYSYLAVILLFSIGMVAELTVEWALNFRKAFKR